jgi:ankyrin repeat protein
MSVDPQTQNLFDAISAVNYDRVKQLIDSGAIINHPNDLGQTPLMVACRRGNLEIVDLLVAAGAQMQAPTELTIPQASHTNNLAQRRSLPLADAPESPVRDREIPLENLIDLIYQPAQNNPTEIEAELPESPVQDREIPLENLIDLIHQPAHNSPTEIEQIISIEPRVLVSQVQQHNTDLHRSAANLPDLSSDAEATYTFDLDAVFAANASPDSVAMFQDEDIFAEELTMTGLQRPAEEVQYESGETYVFDLSTDLDRLSAEADQEPDRLSMPMGEWAENETYVMDGFGLLPAIDLVSAEARQIPLQQQPEVVGKAFPLENRLFTIDENVFSATDDWEEGETYAIDLDDLQLADLMGSTEQSAQSERHLLDDLDPSVFPVLFQEATATNDGDEPDYDPDTQTSTDIFGHSDSSQSQAQDLAPPEEENATNTSLMAAVIDGDLDLAQQAIEAGASLDRYDWNLSYSPLGMAIDRGHLDLVRCLLAAGANPHCGSTATTALGLAAESGEVEIIQMLLPRGVDVNTPVGQDGWTALLSAIKNGHRSVVQLLVTAGANVNIWSRGETPVLLAAKCEEREIYQYLYPLVNTAIRLCADRDGEHLLQATQKRRIRQQNRPVEKFIEMAAVGNIEEVNRAIEIGIEIDELGAQGHTALMAAADRGHRSIVKILLAAGADPNLLSDDEGLGVGMTAMMLAAGSFFASNRQQIVRLLIDSGADVNQRGAGGKTAIFYAALAGSGYADCVETLITAGANLDLHNDRGHTVLTAVATAENYPIFNLLMQAGASTAGLESIQLIQAASAGNIDRVQSLLAANVNLDLDRGAAIGNAAAAGHTKIVELLIQAGANVNLRDKLGFTPIASAAYAGYSEIVNLLIVAGADIQAPPGESQSYSALEYAQMGLYQFDASSEHLQHAQIIRQLEQLRAN